MHEREMLDYVKSVRKRAGARSLVLATIDMLNNAFGHSRAQARAGKHLVSSTAMPIEDSRRKCRISFDNDGTPKNAAWRRFL